MNFTPVLMYSLDFDDVGDKDFASTQTISRSTKCLSAFSEQEMLDRSWIVFLNDMQLEAASDLIDIEDYCDYDSIPPDEP